MRNLCILSSDWCDFHSGGGDVWDVLKALNTLNALINVFEFFECSECGGDVEIDRNLFWIFAIIKTIQVMGKF